MDPSTEKYARLLFEQNTIRREADAPSKKTDKKNVIVM